jgi:hypothetical protein
LYPLPENLIPLADSLALMRKRPSIPPLIPSVTVLPSPPLEPIEVIICSLDTHLCTEATLLTLLHYNQDQNLLVSLIAPQSCREWSVDLCERTGARLLETQMPYCHDQAIEFGYRNRRSDLILHLDSDVIFLGDGVIADMRMALSSKVFCVGVGSAEAVGLAWISKDVHQWGKVGYWLTPRIPLWCSLLRSTPDMERVVKMFGFFPGMRSADWEFGVYYDTAGLFTDVMRVMEYKDVYVENLSRVHHWGSMSWMNGKNEQYEATFKQIIADHPIADHAKGSI